MLQLQAERDKDPMRHGCNYNPQQSEKKYASYMVSYQLDNLQLVYCHIDGVCLSHAHIKCKLHSRRASYPVGIAHVQLMYTQNKKLVKVGQS